MEVYTAVVTKRDLRAYTREPVGDEELRRILQAGRMAGSAKATEPCRFVVVRDPEGRKRLSETGAYAGWIENVPACVAVVLLPDGRPFDAGRCAQNMMVVAHGLGIASCPVTVGEGAADVLGLPEGHAVAIVVALGHPAPDADTTGRLLRERQPFDEYVHNERWEA